MELFFGLLRNRKVFNEPIVRAKINRLRFPMLCPVCGEPATTTTCITTSPKIKRWLRPHWDPAFSASSRKHLGLTLPEKKNFLIQVCDKHQVADDGEWKLRSISLFFATIVASISVFVLMFAGSDIWAGYGIRPWVLGYFLILAVSLLVGFIAFRPNALESAVKIIGFDFDIQYVWFYIKNVEYRRKLIEENGMSVELVNWIVKL